MGFGYEYDKEVTPETAKAAQDVHANLQAAGMTVTTPEQAINARGDAVMKMTVQDPASGRSLDIQVTGAEEYADNFLPNGRVTRVEPFNDSNGVRTLPFNTTVAASTFYGGLYAEGMSAVTASLTEHVKTGKTVYIGHGAEKGGERHETKEQIYYTAKAAKAPAPK